MLASMFSIKINKIGTDKRAYLIIKNTIRFIELLVHLFDYSADCLDDDLLPRSAWVNFEKLAMVLVASSENSFK